MAVFKPMHWAHYEERTDSNEHFADKKPKWQVMCRRLRVELMPITGSEPEIADQINSQTTYRIRTRFNKVVHPYGRFKLCGEDRRVFEIHAVINEKEENKYLRCFCIEDITITKRLKKDIDKSRRHNR